MALTCTDAIIAKMQKLDQFAQEAGRDPASISVSIFAAPPKDELVSKFRDTRVAFSLLRRGFNPTSSSLVLEQMSSLGLEPD